MPRTTQVVDELYEGLPDDAGYFERDDGFVLRTRSVKGVRKPMWVKVNSSGNESKKTPKPEELTAFEEWKECQIDGTHPEVPDEEPESEESESTEESPSVDVEFVPPFATNDDEKAIEIWGTLEEAITTQHEDEDTGKVHCTMTATVKDINGELHTFDVPKGGVANVLSAHDAPKWCPTSRPFHDADRQTRDEEITRLIGMHKTLLWRVLKKDQRKDAEEARYPLMLTVRTNQWVKTTASDIKPYVKEALRSQNISYESLKVQKSDGVYGGRVRVEFSDNQSFKPSLEVVAGRLGGQSFRVFGSAAILACSNQLTMEVRKEVLSLLDHEDIRIKSFSRKVHRGDMQEVMSGVIEVAEAMASFNGMLDEAKEKRISQEMAKKVLLYYERKKVISKKVRELAESYLGNEEVEQVKGTYYGLGMILSYVGSHGEMKKGVSYRLGTLAGEVILVAKNNRRFTDLVSVTLDAPEPEAATA